jgi:hypothetical protein
LGGGSEVFREENRYLNNEWGVTFAADISDEFVGNYDVIVELSVDTECTLSNYDLDPDFDEHIDDPNFKTGELCGFEVKYNLDVNEDEVVDARIVLSHDLSEDDQVSIIGLGSASDPVKSVGLHISFWQGDTPLSTWDCDGNGNIPSADPFTLVSDEPVRVEIRHYRYPNTDDVCSVHTQQRAQFELECDDGFHDPSDDCNEFLVSNDNDDSYLIFHNTLTTATSSAPPHVLFGVSSINDGAVNVNLVSQNNESSTLVQRNILSGLVQGSNSNLSYQSFDLGEESLGDLQTVISSAEAGSSSFTHVDFTTPFAEIPIVLPTLTYEVGDIDLQIEIKDVSKFGFKVRLKDAYNSLNGEKRAFSYLAVEEGESSINGRKIIVGRTSNQINHNWSNLSFPNSDAQNFDGNQMPYLFAIPQTSNGANTSLVMYQNLTSTGVGLRLVGENEYNSPSYFSNQEIGYLILGPDVDCICQNPITDIDYELSHPNCGMNNGSFELKPIGGVSPFIYSIDGTSYDSNNNGGLLVENLLEGTYSIEITDSNGCLFNEEIVLLADGLYMDDFIAENVDCQGSEFNVIVDPLGGTPPYTYSWNNGNTSADLKNVSQGNYYVTVVDSDGCIGIRSFNLRNMYLSLTKNDASCDLDNGSLNAHPIGISPFEYLWSTGETTDAIGNLTPGLYTVTVTDASGCTKTTSKSILPDGQIDFNYAHPFCGVANGFAEIIIEGVHPINYNWNSGQITNRINNLGPGSYSVTATDAQGCISLKTISLNNTNAVSLGSIGGNEGFSDGRFIPAGVTVNWSFDPQSVTDQLIITSDAYGVILNTGGVTRRESNCCGIRNCCSDFFLGDYSNSPIDLLVGSGFVLEGIDYSGCMYSGFLTGSFTTTEDSYISIDVIGSNCGGSTWWSFAMSCSENTNSILDEMGKDVDKREEGAYVLSNTEVVSTEMFSLYPNPAASVIYFEILDELVGSEFKIYTPEGILLLKNTFNDLGGIISLDGFPNGVCILQIESAEGFISRKFVVSK